MASTGGVVFFRPRSVATTTVNRATGAVVFVSFRSTTGLWSRSSVTSSIDQLKSLLPGMNVPAIDSQGKFTPSWYRFFDYLVNQYLGGLVLPSVQDIVTAVEASNATSATVSQQTALIQQQAQANAEALAATVEVVTNNALPGADQIPPVSRTYLEN